MQTHLDPERHQIGSKTPQPFRPEPQEAEIRQRAFQIYEERGRTEGHAMNDWLQAKAEVASESSKSPAA